MARTVTWDELRDLAGFEAEKGFAISVYLDLDPSAVPTAGRAQTRLNSLLDGAARENGSGKRELTHQRRLSRSGMTAHPPLLRIRIRAEQGARPGDLLCRARQRLAAAAAHRGGPGRGQGQPPALPRAARPAPRPGQGARWFVVGRERGELLRLRGGRLEHLADHFEEQPSRHDQGGWAQASLQRHIDELAADHLRVAEDRPSCAACEAPGRRRDPLRGRARPSSSGTF